MRSSFVAALSVLAVGGGIVASPASAALTGDQEIAALNQQRAINGIPGDLVEVSEWSAGCAKHMAYTRAWGLQHQEDPTKPEYSLEGATAGLSSVLSGTGRSFTDAGLNDFQHAPIHLMQMLNPVMLRTGAADGCLATLRDTSRPVTADAAYSYPGAGGVALTKETAYEGPFVPGDFVDLPMGTQTGPHLFFYAFKAGASADWNSKGKITAATLKGPGPSMASLPIKTVDNSTVGAPGSKYDGQKLGDYLSPGGILIPVSPLVKGGVYAATVNFAFNRGGTITRTWQFTASDVLPQLTIPASTRPPVVVPPVVQPPAVTPSPAPAPTPAPPAAPADTSPVALTQVKLKAHTLAVRASRDAPLWITIEAGRTTGKGKRKRTTWKFRESLSVDVKMGVPNSFTHRKLAKGQYRVTFRLGGAKGAVQLTKTTKVK